MKKTSKARTPEALARRVVSTCKGTEDVKRFADELWRTLENNELDIMITRLSRITNDIH
jgi:hypothetical protein